MWNEIVKKFVTKTTPRKLRISTGGLKSQKQHKLKQNKLLSANDFGSKNPFLKNLWKCVKF